MEDPRLRFVYNPRLRSPEDIPLAMNTITNCNEVKECEMDEIDEIIESFVENSQDH